MPMQLASNNFGIIAKYYDDKRLLKLPACEDLLVKVAALINNRGNIVAMGFTFSSEVLQLYIDGLTFPLETEIKRTLLGRIQEKMIISDDGSLDFFRSGSMGFICIQGNEYGRDLLHVCSLQFLFVSNL